MALLSHGATLIMVATAKMWKKHSRVACSTLTPLELLSLQWRPMALLSHGGDANDGGNSENVKEALTSGVQHSPRLHSIPHVLCSIDWSFLIRFWMIFCEFLLCLILCQGSPWHFCLTFHMEIHGKSLLIVLMLMLMLKLILMLMLVSEVFLSKSDVIL